MAVQITGVRVSFGANEVLSDVSATISARERVALVGRNGAGKTTLLRVIAGELAPNAGAVHVPAGTGIALHDQRPPLAAGRTLADYVSSGASRARELEEELGRLEGAMAAGEAGAVRRYGAVQHAFEQAGGYGWRARLEAVARGLGFAPDDLERPLQSFSGGELTRASLARALAAEPDVLLLDEPTNHLDVGAIEWLEDHLDGLAAAVVFVSHDRWFLESLATGVLELERGRGRSVRIGYSGWRALKAQQIATQTAEHERQLQEIAHLQRFVDRFRYGTKARQAQSKLKAIARIELVDRPRGERSLAFSFPPPPRSARVVAEARGLELRAGGRTLLDDGSFAIERGQRVALIGPNGAGKTTLVETLLGRRAPAAGSVRLGHGVVPALYSQQTLELPEHARALDVMVDRTGLTRPQARTLLGRFLFPGEAVETEVAALSGGERRRLALARLVVSGANLLVLDEPTNHLDIESREALEDALLAFAGTILFVSHDRALIEAVATRTLALADGRLVARDGAFGDYARALEAARPAAAISASAPKPKAQPAPRPRRPSQRAAREAARLEEAISRMEEQLGAIEVRLSNPDAYTDDAALAEDGRRHAALQEELAWLMRDWERYAAEAAGSA